MVQIELDFTKAAELADNGIKVAVANADAHAPGWSDRAFKFVKRFADINKGREFMAENIRVWAYENGLDVPINDQGEPRERAWGGVMARAIRAYVVKNIGSRKTSNINAHGAHATFYTA